MRDLLEAARAVQARAYAPYSGFRVGCALRAETGAVFTGANVENAAYPQGQCAETSAIGAMIAGGARRILEVAVVGDGLGPCAPCGGCRQRLNEFAGPEVTLHMAGQGGRVLSVTLADLLPYAFGPSDLGGPGSPCDPDGSTGRGHQADGAGAPRQGASGALAVVRARTDLAPQVAVVLGSGLGALADAVTDPVAVPYAELPGFPRPSVEGHAGRLVLGRLAGVPVALMQGRAHLYEGAPADWPAVPVRTLAALGCDILVLTNAAGSLRPDLGPGRIVLLADHINALGANPLTGPNDDAAGPRFPDMSVVFDPQLRAELRAAASTLSLDLAEGVYLATPGPSFETPAEIRAMRTLGADLVGMSTVPEAIVARHAGLRVAGLSVVTNLAAGMTETALGHDETLAQARQAGRDLGRLLTAWLAARAGARTGR